MTKKQNPYERAERIIDTVLENLVLWVGGALLVAILVVYPIYGIVIGAPFISIIAPWLFFVGLVAVLVLMGLAMSTWYRKKAEWDQKQWEAERKENADA
jgi:type VI protein secretion system component VasK